jgi:copper chaperone
METIKVNNMTCEHCVKRIDEALKKLNLDHSIKLETKTVEVDANKLQLFEVFEALDEMGYEADIVK